MKLPGANLAILETAKLRDYLLHPDKTKARLFSNYGFNREAWQVLGGALAAHPLTNDVTSVVDSPHGVKYVVTRFLATPDGRNPCMTSVWIVEDAADRPRLVTAY